MDNYFKMLEGSVTISLDGSISLDKLPIPDEVNWDELTLSLTTNDMGEYVLSIHRLVPQS
jgi:hypothetical protein